MALKAVVLSSGGINSMTCLAIAKAEGLECHLLTFSYGQEGFEEERLSTERVASVFSNPHRHVVDLQALQYFGQKTIKRDYLFIQAGMEVVRRLGAHYLFFGVHAKSLSDEESRLFSIFRESALKEANHLIPRRMITLRTPLITMDKSDVIACGNDLGVDFSVLSPRDEQTYTRYEHCETHRALSETGFLD